jgi:hypothetical protein
MSGLEPLAVVGLTCNIIELIQVGRDVAAICISISKTGSSDPELETKTTFLEKAFKSVEQSLGSVPVASDRDEQELLAVSEKALSTARDLRVELEKISRGASEGVPKIALVRGPSRGN